HWRRVDSTIERLWAAGVGDANRAAPDAAHAPRVGVISASVLERAATDEVDIGSGVTGADAADAESASVDVKRATHRVERSAQAQRTRACLGQIARAADDAAEADVLSTAIDRTAAGVDGQAAISRALATAVVNQLAGRARAAEADRQGACAQCAGRAANRQRVGCDRTFLNCHRAE